MREAADAYDSGEEAVWGDDDKAFIDNEGVDDEDVKALMTEEKFDDEAPQTDAEKKKKAKEEEAKKKAAAKKGKRRKNEVSDEVITARAKALLDDMVVAVESDEAHKRSGGKGPALARMRMLPRVRQGLLNRRIAQVMILGPPSQERWDTNVLHVLARWLKPVGNSLPALQLRQALLPVIGQLQVPVEMMAGNDLGKVLMFLHSHPQETDANKRLLGNTINSWVRQMTGKAASMRAGVEARAAGAIAEDEEETMRMLRDKQAEVARVAGMATTIPVSRATREALEARKAMENASKGGDLAAKLRAKATLKDFAGGFMHARQPVTNQFTYTRNVAKSSTMTAHKAPAVSASRQALVKSISLMGKRKGRK
jgi:hypothetical protein